MPPQNKQINTNLKKNYHILLSSRCMYFDFTTKAYWNIMLWHELKCVCVKSELESKEQLKCHLFFVAFKDKNVFNNDCQLQHYCCWFPNKALGSSKR